MGIAKKRLSFYTVSDTSSVLFKLVNFFQSPAASGTAREVLFLLSRGIYLSQYRQSALILVMDVDFIGFGYAALVTAGGVIGYLKAGSVTSLVAGLLFGLLAAVGAYLASQRPKNVWLSLGTAGTLAVVMGLRFLSSWKFMPAGLMTLASALMLVKITVGMLKTRQHTS